MIKGNRDIWIEFCRKNEIAITDIIVKIDADVNNFEQRETVCKFKDADLLNYKVEINNIVSILNRFPTITQICITRQRKGLSAFWLNCFMATIQYIEQNPQRKIQIRYLRSPSRGAIKGVIGDFCDFIANKWINQGYQLNS